ncbi:MAG TPA: hypothetical protein VEI02_05545, partial [Planctomycetota bacterium]|nr:hypothetical protein [Planctomycetota bacterium]
MSHRWSAAVLAVLACAGAFGQAPQERGADSKLLEILRRRGVIDAAEYEEVKKELDAEVRRSDLDAALDARLDEMTARVVQDAPKISYKPGTGFGFKTADGNFALSIGGRLQAR